MLHRVIQDLPGPVPVDPAADVAYQRAMIERGERRLALLDRLTDMAMSLAEALHRKALERIESGEVEDEGKGTRDPLAEFNKTAQTLRRTIALEAKLAAAVLQIVGMDDPPLRLLLGQDVLHAFREKSAAWSASVEDWRDLTVSMNFD